jgi:phosphate transport system substrate-binding protein
MDMKRITYLASSTLAIACILVLGGAVCAEEKLEGKVMIDGSSTVAPISMAAAELFQREHRGVRVTVGISGTGGGFKKFLADEPELRTDINDASRAIKEREIERAKLLGVEFIEIPIALDGMAVMVHPSNNFVDHLTVEELKKIWEPESSVSNWNQVRDGFHDVPLSLYGPGPDSGTFDYFTEAIVGKEKASRSDYTASESDNMLVRGIAGDQGSLGYFGFSYYETNKGKLKLVPIANGEGKPVLPELETIRSGTYTPLSRPLFLYINAKSAQRPEVQAFMKFLIENADRIAKRVNYVPLEDSLYEVGTKRLTSGTTGSPMAKAQSGSADLRKVFGAD